MKNLIYLLLILPICIGIPARAQVYSSDRYEYPFMEANDTLSYTYDEMCHVSNGSNQGGIMSMSLGLSGTGGTFQSFNTGTTTKSVQDSIAYRGCLYEFNTGTTSNSTGAAGWYAYNYHWFKPGVLNIF